MESPDPKFVLRGSEAPVTALAFYGEYLLSGCQYGNIYAWDLKTLRPVNKIHAHRGNSVLWLQEISETRLVSQGRDGAIKLWEIKGLKHWNNTGMITCSAMGFCSGVLFVDGGHKLALPSEVTSEIKLVNVDNVKDNQKIVPPAIEGKKYGMCMVIKLFVDSSIGDTQLLVGYENGVIVLYDVKTRCPRSSLAVHQEAVMAMDFLHYDSKCFGVSGSVDNKLHFWGVENGALQFKNSIEITNKGINDIAIRGDGRIFATGGWDSRIRIFTVKRQKPLAVLAMHKESVQTVLFSSEGLLVAGSKDKTISVWNIYQNDKK